MDLCRPGYHDQSVKKRSSYYNYYYSNKKWGDPRSYLDLCLNSSVTSLDGAVDVILSFAEVKAEDGARKNGNPEECHNGRAESTARLRFNVQ